MARLDIAAGMPAARVMQRARDAQTRSVADLLLRDDDDTDADAATTASLHETNSDPDQVGKAGAHKADAEAEAEADEDEGERRSRSVAAVDRGAPLNDRVIAAMIEAYRRGGNEAAASEIEASLTNQGA